MSYITETHLAELMYPWCSKLHPSGSNKHRELLTNTVWARWGATPQLSSSSCSHPEKWLRAGVFAKMGPLPSPGVRHSVLSHSCISIHIHVTEYVVVPLDWLFLGIFTSQQMHHKSNDTAPHPKPYRRDGSFRLFLSLCISLHSAGRDSSLTERDFVEVHLILNCNVIFVTLETPLLSYV